MIGDTKPRIPQAPSRLLALLLRGDHELNKIKAEKIDGVAAGEEEVIRACNCKPGSIGPLGLTIKIIADRSVTLMSDFVCGANQDGKHYRGVNWERDLPAPVQIEDIRTVVEGDASPDGSGKLTLARGISRVVAAAIEQDHDSKGIIWPANLAPFQVALCPMNMHKSERLKEASEKLYQDLLAAGIDVLFDDRKVRAGFMFSDMELIGIPHCIVLGDRGLDNGTVEYKARTAQANEEIPFADIIAFLKAKLNR